MMSTAAVMRSSPMKPTTLKRRFRCPRFGAGVALMHSILGDAARTIPEITGHPAGR
jgi:hypothetical protein